MDINYAGRVALVTGGTTGIGRAAAIAFGQAGASVVVTGRREKEGLQTVELVKKTGAKATFVEADVAREADARKSVDETLRTYGRLDVAFNNAGIEGDKGVLTADLTEPNYRSVMDINVGGVLWSMKYEIPAMLRSGSGAIVNNASIAATVGFPGMAVYVASKHAVLGLTRTTALEYAKQGVRVNAISPAAVETPMIERFIGRPDEASDFRQQLTEMHPIGRTGTPDEIAAAVMFLCSPAAGFITGANLLADGGLTAQ